MVIFDKSNNNNGLAQGTLYIQGMDIVLLLQHFDETFLIENVAPDFLEAFYDVVKNIYRKKDEDSRDGLLWSPLKLGIEYTKLDNGFKLIIENLLAENVLYTKKRLSSIQAETLDSKIAQIKLDRKGGAIVDYRTDYELNSLRCAKYVIEQINLCNNITKDLFEYNAINRNDAIRKIQFIQENLKSMGLDVAADEEENMTPAAITKQQTAGQQLKK